MTISMPLWLLLGFLAYMAWRYAGLRVWHLVACIALGVLLAATPAGPDISNVLAGIVYWFHK
jgi:hypothetical protein